MTRIILGLTGMLLATMAAAQDGRPRVALVLGGGGARGAAHVGVIQVLEEMRVPVDYVLGTSMGSIVGGLYAAGYAPDDMAKIIEQTDWSVILSDDPPRDELWFRRRQDDRRFQVDLQLGWKNGGPVLPPGLILGLNVDQFLEGLLLPVAGTFDFDDLPIPFRCIGIDIANGTSVVFERGSLAKAIRASISLPGIFAPVEYEGRVIVDGGFVDNVPVGVARELGADVVIVVDVATPIADPRTRQSLVGIYDQVIRIMMDENRKLSLETLAQQDIGIRPELPDMSSMEFARSAEAIPAGREAAEAVRERLAALSVDEATWSEWLAEHRGPKFESPAVRKITIGNETRFSDRVIREFAAIRPGDSLDAASLAKTREQLAGLGVFERIQIDIADVPGSPDQVDVALRPIDKGWGPHYLRFGLGLSSDLQGSGEFDFGVQHTWTPMNGLGGEWRNEIQIGSRTRLFSEYYQPLDPGLRWFVAPSVEYEQDDLPLIIDRQKIAELDLQAFRAGLSLGRNVGSWGEVRAGYDWIWGSAEPEIAIPGLFPSSIDIDGGQVSAELSVDTLDQISFPSKGLFGDLRWERADASISGNGDRSDFEGAFGIPVSFGALTLFPKIEGGLTFDGESTIGGNFFLGGFQRLSGLEQRELSGNNYMLGVVETYYRFSRRTTRFDVATFVGATVEYGGLWQQRSRVGDGEFLLAGSVFVGADTFIGPVYIAFGLAEGGESAFYVFIGPRF